MKRLWQADELEEHWTLQADELVIIHEKKAADCNKLGLAVLLKYFRQEGQFPEHKRDIPKVVVEGSPAHFVVISLNVLMGLSKAHPVGLTSSDSLQMTPCIWASKIDLTPFSTVTTKYAGEPVYGHTEIFHKVR